MALIIRLCCFFYILSIIQAGWFTRNPDIYYKMEMMGKHEKEKIMFLSVDLFKDSLLKMRQIVSIRLDHDRTVAYSIGMIMGRIREKYRHMLETYRDIIVSYHDWSVPRPPSVRYFRPFHFVIALEMMHYLEVEIDKLVDVIIEEATEDVLRNSVYAGEEQRPRKSKNNGTNTTFKPGPGLPPGPPPIPATTKIPKKPQLRGRAERLMEEAEKSLMRQRYLMKKLGHPINMTTMKKRFIRHWPVEDSWLLDKYNYNYK